MQGSIYSVVIESAKGSIYSRGIPLAIVYICIYYNNRMCERFYILYEEL